MKKNNNNTQIETYSILNVSMNIDGIPIMGTIFYVIKLKLNFWTLSLVCVSKNCPLKSFETLYILCFPILKYNNWDHNVCFRQKRTENIPLVALEIIGFYECFFHCFSSLAHHIIIKRNYHICKDCYLKSESQSLALKHSMCIFPSAYYKLVSIFLASNEAIWMAFINVCCLIIFGSHNDYTWLKIY